MPFSLVLMDSGSGDGAPEWEVKEVVYVYFDKKYLLPRGLSLSSPVAAMMARSNSLC